LKERKKKNIEKEAKEAVQIPFSNLFFSAQQCIILFNWQKDEMKNVLFKPKYRYKNPEKNYLIIFAFTFLLHFAFFLEFLTRSCDTKENFFKEKKLSLHLMWKFKSDLT